MNARLRIASNDWCVGDEMRRFETEKQQSEAQKRRFESEKQRIEAARNNDYDDSKL
jgi:hypothetical protein